MTDVFAAAFDGPSVATNRIAKIPGSENYFGQFPDFTTVVATLVDGAYRLQVLNFHNVPGWPTRFVMNKSDSNPGNVVGAYENEDGTCIVLP